MGVKAELLARGEAALAAEWPALPATLFLEFAREGNRSRFQASYFRRRNLLCDLVLAECVEGQGQFLDGIANGVWAICEESFWGVPAHIWVQRDDFGLPDTTDPVVDLFVAETASLLAWTDYLLGPTLDDVSPLIRPRIAREIDLRMLTPCLERDDFQWIGQRGSGEQLESVDQLELVDLRAVDRDRSGTAAGGGRKEYAQPGRLHRRVPGGWRL